MRQITKKYIFEQKLKGEPIDLLDYNTMETWEKIIPTLIELNIISKDSKTNIFTDINQDKGPEDRWYFQYAVRITSSDHEPSTWIPRFK